VWVNPAKRVEAYEKCEESACAIFGTQIHILAAFGQNCFQNYLKMAFFAATHAQIWPRKVVNKKEHVIT